MCANSRTDTKEIHKQKVRSDDHLDPQDFQKFNNNIELCLDKGFGLTPKLKFGSMDVLGNSGDSHYMGTQNLGQGIPKSNITSIVTSKRTLRLTPPSVHKRSVLTSKTDNSKTSPVSSFQPSKDGNNLIEIPSKPSIYQDNTPTIDRISEYESVSSRVWDELAPELGNSKIDQ